MKRIRFPRKAQSQAISANEETLVQHDLRYIPEIWFVDENNQHPSGIDIKESGKFSFKITSLVAGTVYYR